MTNIIYYNIQNSIFGKTLIGVTKKGVCAVLFGNTPEIEFANIFKNTELQLIHHPNMADKLIKQINNNEVLKDVLKNVPIDIVVGTPFQRLVWECLHKIRKGTTITYQDLATQIGLPRAVRAVASACGKNPISVIIPCHRVVPKSGGIGKYRWGSEMKQKLIEREQLAL